MTQIKVSYKRHLAKTISYRIVSTLIGFVLMWWVTGDLKFGAAFSIIELIYKPLQYYIHERVWYKYIKFGLEKDNLNVSKPKQKPKEIIEKSQVPRKGKRLSYTKKST